MLLQSAIQRMKGKKTPPGLPRMFFLCYFFTLFPPNPQSHVDRCSGYLNPAKIHPDVGSKKIHARLHGIDMQGSLFELQQQVDVINSLFTVVKYDSVEYQTVIDHCAMLNVCAMRISCSMKCRCSVHVVRLYCVQRPLKKLFKFNFHSFM